MGEGVRVLVGLDVHKDTSAIAAAGVGRSAARLVGQITHDVPKLIKRLARAGELRAVWIPDAGDEAIGDLSRAREDTVNARTQARHQLTAFLLRHGIRHSGKTAWGRGLYRRLLTAAAWNYCFTPRLGRAAQARQKQLTEPIKAIAQAGCPQPQ